MPVQVSYPGVYIQEMPSSVHSIVGASQSATAFVDVFRRGPVNEPTRIDSMGDFDRTFGGVWEYSEASYAISQYFLNGGQTAWVVRVTPSGALTAKGSDDFSYLEAMNPGKWGNFIEVAQETVDGEVFNLAIRKIDETSGVRLVKRSEVHRGLTKAAGPRNVTSVLARESFLLRSSLADPAAPLPDESKMTAAAKQLQAARHKLEADQKALAHERRQLEDEKTKLANTGKDTQAVTTPVVSITRVAILNDAANTTFKPLTGGDDGLSIGDLTASLAEVLPGDAGTQTGVYALQQMAPQTYNLLCLPATALITDDVQRRAIQTAATEVCRNDRAFFIADEPLSTTAQEFESSQADLSSDLGADAAVYFPALTIADPRQGNRPRVVAPSGTVAGVIARTDTARGIWKAPAGTDATLRGATPAIVVNDAVNGQLNELGINVLRSFPTYGTVCWGARTLAGADANTSQWKYLNVRRLALYIENSLYDGTKWAVFEPNDDPLWAQLRLGIGTFMHDLFRQGAFAGTAANDAYFVHCDRTTTTQSDIDRGIVNVNVGFAPLKPAEFVIISIQQIAQG
jgi:uncharacterized protein